MSIDPTRSQELRARTTSATPDVTPARKGEAADAHVRRDQVDISEEARQTLASRPKLNDPPLLEVRLAEIWDRLHGGFYEQDAIREQIAGKIIESGDL